MPQILSQAVHTSRTVAVILGGGAGTRLFPLTKDRAKPAVPLAGKYRLVDIPVSNCINSDIKKIYLLTQYLSSSLHRHVQNTYKFDDFSNGFVEILAAQQAPDKTDGWYQGTADAVRANMKHFDNFTHDYCLILSGDQLYRMDYREMLSRHIENNAAITVGVIPVCREAAKGFGIMDIDEGQNIIRFVEKPKDDALLETLRLDKVTLKRLGRGEHEELYLASMGIYIFNHDTLHTVLEDGQIDFGKHIIPSAIGKHKLAAHIFEGYWEDIGTVKAFYDANLDLCNENPQFDYGQPNAPIFTRPRNLRPNIILNAKLENCALCTGIEIGGGYLKRVLIGNRTIVGRNVDIQDTLLMGADYYESEQPGAIPLGIGEGTVIKTSIIDKNARIGKNCRISPEGKPAHTDHPLYHIRDGIVVVPKNTTIPDGTVI
ncbi:MAG: glucose-1-phosphate adenylyltransferase [Verrucomicrobiae bacterium]|nr:glucose-1-phosphate adenylyltransferase [Verrucomicrobiae bacterium]